MLGRSAALVRAPAAGHPLENEGSPATLSGVWAPRRVAGYAGLVSSGNGTRRIVFLDIDGVLAPIRQWDRYGDLEPACVEVLNEIVVRGGADVVVSSTWRYGKTVAELQDLLGAAGFAGSVIGMTPIGAPGAVRGEEIAAWLAQHTVGGYVILDDHVDMGDLRTHLVLTHPGRGLQPSDVARAIATLMRPFHGVI